MGTLYIAGWDGVLCVERSVGVLRERTDETWLGLSCFIVSIELNRWYSNNSAYTGTYFTALEKGALNLNTALVVSANEARGISFTSETCRWALPCVPARAARMHRYLPAFASRIQACVRRCEIPISSSLVFGCGIICTSKKLQDISLDVGVVFSLLLAQLVFVIVIFMPSKM